MNDLGMDKSQLKKIFLNELLYLYMSEFFLFNKQCKSVNDFSVMEIMQLLILFINFVIQEIFSLLEIFDSSFFEMVLFERFSILSRQYLYKVFEYVVDYLKIDFEEDEFIESQWQ